MRPTGARKHCEVWWHIKLPYLATYLRMNLAADVGGGDLVGLSISEDAGYTRHPIYWQAGMPPTVLENGLAEGPSVRGLREFWLRMTCQRNRPTLRCGCAGCKLRLVIN